MVFEIPSVQAVDVNSVRLTYREVGDPTGPLVVLLHGSSSDAATWEDFGRRLAASGYRSIALDLRGHATSARTADYRLSSIRDDVLGLLDTLGSQDVTLIGHSVGAHAALAAALHAPGRVTRLVLEDLAAPPQVAGSLGVTGIVRGLAAVTVMLAQHRSHDLRGSAGRGYDLRAVASILRQLSRPDPQWWARLSDVRTPTLVLSGGPTSCIPPQRLADVTAAIPGARLATIPVGHRVHSLAPDAFADAVLAFLAGSARSTQPAVLAPS